jgi:peptidoglycan biosynthesis protein MviN/MurJ (putative lipid II flippase)
MDRPGAAALIAAALGGLAAGILGESLLALATASSYAREDAHTPFVTNLAGVALTCTVAVAAALTFEGAALLAALGAAVSAGLLLAAGLLSWTVWSGLPLGMDALVPTLLRVLVASLLMAYPARLVADLLSDPGGGGVQGLIALLAAAATGAVLFAVVLLLLGGRDLLDVRRSVPR